MTMPFTPLNAIYTRMDDPKALTARMLVVPTHSLKTLPLMLTLMLAGMVLAPITGAQTQVDMIKHPIDVEQGNHQPLASPVNPSESSTLVQSTQTVKDELYESTPLLRPHTNQYEVVVKTPQALLTGSVTHPAAHSPQVSTIDRTAPDITLKDHDNITPPTIWVLMDTHLPESVWEAWAEDIETWTQRVQSATGHASPWAISALLWGMPGRLNQGEPDRYRMAAIQTIAPWVQAGLPLAIDPPRIHEVFFGSPKCKAGTLVNNMDPMTHPRLALPAVAIETPSGTTLVEGVPSFGVAVGSLLKHLSDTSQGFANSPVSSELAYWKSVLGRTQGVTPPAQSVSQGRSTLAMSMANDASTLEAKAIRLAKSLGVEHDTIAVLNTHAPLSAVGQRAPRQATRHVGPNASNALGSDLFADLLALGVEPLSQTEQVITEGE